MRILQVHNYYRRSGGECGVVRAEKELLETHGHTVFQFTQDSGKLDHYSLFQKGISFIQIPYNLIVARSLSSFIEINKPDIAHIHNVFPLMSPSVYRTLKRHAVPVVQTIHNYRFLCPNGQLFTRGRICEDCQEHGFSSAVKKRCLHNSFIISLL
jgi:glycosyltransferase involved in cell wall biosynthesis